jgi:flagellar protein FlgJ
MTTQSISTMDVQGLSNLKQLAQTDAQKALPEVAKQFEGIFMQAMLKAMRASHAFLPEDSPFKNDKMNTFQEMLDGQYATTITKGEGLGLAKQLTEAISRQRGIPIEESSQSIMSAKMIDTKLSTLVGSQTLPVVNAAINHVSASTKEVPTSIDHFVKTLLPYAKKAASVLGLDPKLLIAQAALETGWGKSIAKGQFGESSLNYFNIKSVNNEDKSVKIKTKEFVADKAISVIDSFRKYDSIMDSFNDYVNLIATHDRYAQAKSSASNPDRYLKAIHQAGYATDPNYSDKVLSIYHGDILNQAVDKYT